MDRPRVDEPFLKGVQRPSKMVRHAVWSERVSDEFPCLTGNLQGNHLFLRIFAARDPFKMGDFQGYRDEIP